MGLSDLFKPKWKHRDKSVRLTAVETLTDEAALASVALHDDAAEVRSAAVRTIADEAVLAQVAALDSDMNLRLLAVERLQNQGIVMSIASSCAGQVREAALGKLTDVARVLAVNNQELLADVAKHSRHWDVRFAALEALERGPGTSALLNAVLVQAAGGNDATCVRRLLELGADPNATNEFGRSALLLAVDEGDREVITALLDGGANINHPNRGIPTLQWALKVGSHFLELTDWLISRGANVNATNDAGETILMLAVQVGNEQAVTLLLERGAEVNARCALGTPLIFAAKLRKSRLTTLLLNNGADPSLADPSGGFPLLWAIEKRDERIFVQLRDAGADLDAEYKGVKLAVLVREVFGASAGALLRRPSDDQPAWVDAQLADAD